MGPRRDAAWARVAIPGARPDDRGRPTPPTGGQIATARPRQAFAGASGPVSTDLTVSADLEISCPSLAGQTQRHDVLQVVGHHPSLGSQAVTPSSERPRLLLLDGHSLAYRAFYALPVENFSTTTGQPTNAVYGFTSMLINALRDEQPTHVGVAFDVSRHDLPHRGVPRVQGHRRRRPRSSGPGARSSARCSTRCACPSSSRRASRPTTSSPP